MMSSENTRIIWEIFYDDFFATIIKKNEKIEKRYSIFSTIKNKLFDRFPKLDFIVGETIISKGIIRSKIRFEFEEGSSSREISFRGKITRAVLEYYLTRIY